MQVHANLCIATLCHIYPHKLVRNLQDQRWYIKYEHYIFMTFESNEKNNKLFNMLPYFQAHANRMQKKNSICNHTGSRHKIGYRTMCNFWYVDFMKYLHNCSFVLRIDSDIRLIPNQNDPFLRLPKTLSPVEWQKEMDKKKVMYGMIHLFQGINHELTYWESPYTNVMMINMSWINSESVQTIIRIVNDTNCIFYNRWGDLPLWGATVRLLEEEKEYLNLSYYHKSHYNRLVKSHFLQ